MFEGKFYSFRTVCFSDVNADKVQAFIPHLLSKLHLEGLVYGNATKQVCAVGLMKCEDRIMSMLK